jgi:CopG antitoxin of type II toxin-antitoxin system
MTAKATRRPFFDPYDQMTDSDFERHVLEVLDRGTTKISWRVPNDLLGRTRQAAARRGVPYQSLMRVLLDQGVSRLERVPAARAVKRGQGIAGSRIQDPDNGNIPRAPSGRVRRRTRSTT